MAEPLGFTSYEIENDKKFARALSKAAKKIGDLTTPLNQIAADFRKSRKAIFQLSSAGQYPDLSTKPFKAWWEPKESGLNKNFPGGYKEYKQEKFGFAYPILKQTGRLEESLTNRSHPENISRINIDEAELGTSVPYGIYHQSDSPRKRLPLRKFLFIGPEAPRFAKGDALKGFPERAIKTLEKYVLRQTGLSILEATGVKPIIKEDRS